MRKYKINRDTERKLPPHAVSDRFKDFDKIRMQYNEITKRPKQPLYKKQKALYAANINCSSCLCRVGKYKGRKGNGSRKKQNRNERRKGIATSLSLMIIPPIRECFLLFLLFHLP